MGGLSDAERESAEIQEFLRTGRISARMWLNGLTSVATDPFLSFIHNLRGPVGYKLRQLYYGRVLKSMGKNALIDVGVLIHGPQNVSLGDFSWIDAYCILVAPRGGIEIGKRIHLGTGVYLIGSGGLEVHDYAGVSPHAKILSSSEAPVPGMRMSGPMLPMEFRGLKAAKVVLGKDSFVGSNSIVLPGVTLGEGAIVGANSVVNKDVEPYIIVAGCPAKPIGKRKPITVPDL